jgi:protein transport protein SEC61 subunit gamma and related proteins
MSDRVKEIIEVPQQFIREGSQVSSYIRLCTVQFLTLYKFIGRCTKPSRTGTLSVICISSSRSRWSTEFMAICRAVAIGFAVMGFLGYFVKLIHIPMSVSFLQFRIHWLTAKRQKQYSRVRGIHNSTQHYSFFSKTVVGRSRSSVLVPQLHGSVELLSFRSPSIQNDIPVINSLFTSPIQRNVTLLILKILLRLTFLRLSLPKRRLLEEDGCLKPRQ